MTEARMVGHNGGPEIEQEPVTQGPPTIVITPGRRSGFAIFENGVFMSGFTKSKDLGAYIEHVYAPYDPEMPRMMTEQMPEAKVLGGGIFSRR